MIVDMENSTATTARRQRPIVTTELRCERCGETWVEDGPACCADPVSQRMDVRRTFQPEYGLVLIQVLNHRGEIIRGEHLEPLPGPGESRLGGRPLVCGARVVELDGGRRGWIQRIDTEGVRYQPAGLRIRWQDRTEERRPWPQAQATVALIPHGQHGW